MALKSDTAVSDFIMSYYPDDTICAIATAAGGAARGMIRASGPDAVRLVSPLFHADAGFWLGRLRQATAITGQVRIDIDASPRYLPCDLFVWPSRRSYTREPVVELHTLGSPPLLELIVAAICAAGARLAEPGEFTLRAFLAGRIDLTQAEAVLGVIDAHGADDLGNALSQLAGGLARPLHQLRDVLLQLLADVEAGLDFVEEDIEFVTPHELGLRLNLAARQLAVVAEQLALRHAASGFGQVVLVGPPNAGKSSLFNALSKRFERCDELNQPQRPAALVSSISGTTRDYLTANISLDGMSCELVDTAGIAEAPASSTGEKPGGMGTDAEYSNREIDNIAQALGEKRIAQAALRIFCLEAPALLTWDAVPPSIYAANCDILVLTKCDLIRKPAALFASAIRVPIITTSSVRGDGLDKLAATLRALLARALTAQRGQAVATTAGRCRESIRLAGDAINRARKLASAGDGHELIALELRTALHELGKVVGVVYTDDLLDRIFSTFCIGK